MKAPPVSADALSPDVGSANPRVVVGIPPSDPPPAGSSETPSSVEAKGNIDGVIPSLPAPTGVDPLDALEALEKPSAPLAPAAQTDDTKASATSSEPREERDESGREERDEKAREEREKSAREERDEKANAENDETTRTFASLGSTIAFGSASDGEPAPAAPVQATSASTAPAAEKRNDLTSTQVLGSNAKHEDAEPANTKRSLASTMALGSANEATRSEPQAAETTEKIEPVAAAAAVVPVKVAEAPLPTSKPAAPKEARVDRADEPEAAPAASADTSATSTGKKNKNKKNKKAGRERAEAAAADATDPDEISVPPIGDLGVDDEKFFSEGDLSRHDAIEGEDALTIPDKAKRKAEPHVIERRARFVRYVKWAVAGAAVVCLAAVARTTLTSSQAPASAARSAAVVAPVATDAPQPAAPKAATQAAAPIATTAPTEAPAAMAEPTAANVAAPATAAPPASAETTEPATETKADEVLTGDAKEEKTKARTFLEKRKIADAIEAGERSVKLDPTDGEAWLILGAAYQEKGNMVEARRAYAACVKEGKTGPRSECAKMLR